MSKARRVICVVWVLGFWAAYPAAGEPLVTMPLAFVAGADSQPGGPVYDYRIGIHEVTNEQFVAFLNDATVNLDNERGHYLYFDTDSGDVFIHNDLVGVMGTDGAGTPIFDASINGYIFYDPDISLYGIEEGFAEHPVAGVSWYGALKFCNWLTLDQELAADQRCYTEAPSTNLNGWHPAAITDADWAIRNLNDAEQLAWINDYTGFRLPMDDGAASASAYNEWYKAAAWRNDIAANATYGFGRETITGSDANFNCSGDEFEDAVDCGDGGSAYIAYFDGSVRDPKGVNLQTLDTENSYGLYDLSGNLWEWMTDQRSGPSFRSLRGGSWLSSTTSLKTTATTTASPGSVSTLGTFGFRVAQVAQNVLQVQPEALFSASGPYGGYYDLPEQIYTVTNLTSLAMFLSVTPDVDWLSVNGSPEIIDLPLEANAEIAVIVAILTDCAAQNPSLGENPASLTFITDLGSDGLVRDVLLSITEPLTLSPDSDFVAEGFFDGPFAGTQEYTVTSVSAGPIDWSASADQAWVLFNDFASTRGTIEPPDQTTATVTVSLDISTELLDVGTHTAALTFSDDCTGHIFDHTLTLTIKEPMSLSPAEGSVFGGVTGGPFSPDLIEYVLSNVADRTVAWEADFDATWLRVNDASFASGSLSVGESATLSLEVTGEADGFLPAVYTASMSVRDVTDPAHVFEMTRTMTLDVSDLDVTPIEPFEASGPVGGPFTPDETLYVITNHGTPEFEWQVTRDVDWIDLDGADSVSGIIVEPEGAASITATVNVNARSLPAGEHTASLTFSDLMTGATAVRTIALEVGSTSFTIPMALVSGAEDQPGGPTYDYRIGVYEVTNAEFSTFLNNAIANLSDPKGQYLYHDTDSGDVYIHSAATGTLGVSGAGTLIFSAASGGAISFDGLSYIVAEGMESLPVVGVTWFGAVKFCNWMTLIQRMNVTQRVYAEGPTPQDWFPMTIGSEINGTQADTYATRDLSDSERLELLSNHAGFRLPMDHGQLTSAPYNEWYKAAGMDDSGEVEAVYGFGRATLTAKDANYLSSGDPFEPGPSPVGYYNGTDHDGSFATADTGNAHGLYDLCGNVREWMQDQGVDPAERGLRGGHYETAQSGSALRNDDRAERLAEDVQPYTGFRVAQSALFVPLTVTALPLNASGVVGGAYTPSSFTVVIGNSSLASHEWLATLDVDWCELETGPGQSGIAEPGTSDQLYASFNELTDDLVTTGEHSGNLTIHDLTSDAVTVLPLKLTLSEPVTFMPVEGLTFTGLFGDDFSVHSHVYTAANVSATEMAWNAAVDQTWVTATPGGDGFDPIPGGEIATLTVSMNSEASSLPPGEHSATLTLENSTTGYTESRTIQLTIDPTLEITPSTEASISGVHGGPFTPETTTLNLINRLNVGLSYTLAVDVDWLSVADESGDDSGTLGPLGLTTLTLTVTSDAENLAVGDHTAEVSITDSASDSTQIVTVTLAVAEPLTVTEGDFASFGNFGGPFVPSEAAYRLSNTAISPLDWTVTVDQSWVTVDGGTDSAGSLDPGDNVVVTLGFTDETLLFAEGAHTAVASFTNLRTGTVVTRQVTLSVDEGLSVTPLTGYEAYAAVGGEATPLYLVYRLRNFDAVAIDYRVETDQTWVTVDGGESVSGTLEVGDSTHVLIAIDQALTSALGPGTHSSLITSTNLTNGFGTTSRPVTLNLVLPHFAPDMAPIGADVIQPSGPLYTFEIGRHEVTNAQFAAFLNDALANPDHERGHYMYHDTDSGDVYIHSGQTGSAGTEGAGTKIFGALESAAITFDGVAYVIDPGFEQHPVVGVTWYGAIKFCNWLTLDQGLPPDERCYLESTSDDLNGWRPTTITAERWAIGDLNDAERQSLIAGYAGYRLPMDDGAGNSNPATDSADAFNEWYKAAAWNIALNSNTLYGFGRNAFVGADANYLSSGDPFDNAATPVGYYDGTDHGGIYPTNDTSNSFRLYDMTGNVSEWVQDRYVGPITSGLRSNSYLASIKAVTTRSSNFANSPNSTIGFRAVRVPAGLPGDGDGDADVDLPDLGEMQRCFTGPGSFTLSSSCATFDFDADQDVDVADFSAFQFVLTGP